VQSAEFKALCEIKNENGEMKRRSQSVGINLTEHQKDAKMPKIPKRFN
jgi:hypothetical protein